MLVAAMVVAWTASGCSGQEPSTAIQGTTTGAGMAIEFRTETSPAADANQFEVVVKKDGAAVNDATVTARFSMPAMPAMNMPEMHSDAALEPAGDGRYRGIVQLSMAGTWNVLIRVSKGGQELGTSTVSIVAK
jgi:hypothetical protein